SVNGETPVLGATDTGILYQDDREFHTDVLLTVIHENGSIVYNKTLKSNAYGEVGDILENLEVGKYNVLATHFEDNYYKEIVNSTSFTVLPQADVKINKIKEESDFNYKDYVMWNLTIKNNGPNKATDIIIQDLIPEGLIFIKSNYGQYNPTTGILKIDGIEPSQSITLSIITQINKTGKIVNNANVTAGEYDPDLTNNHDFDFIEVNPSADLSIEKSVSQKNPNFGDEISWKIIAINNGPDDATDVKVIDNLPEGLIWISDDSNGDYNPNTGIWNIKNLAKDETKTLTIKCKVNKTGKLTNNVSISGNEYDWNNSNNNDSESIEVPKAADLEVSKEVNNSNPNYLDAIKWTITVKNNGPDSATGVILKDIMPEGLVILTHSGGADFDGITWNVGELANGEVKELYIYCRVNKTGDFENIVTVKGNEFDQNETNNNDSEVIHVKTAADLKVIKTVNNKNPIFQDTICWSIEIKNNGPDMATDVVVTDIIPVGLTYLKNTASKGSYDIKTGLWKINAINPFSSEYLDIYCKVDKTGKFVNNVSVRANEYDYDESNNNDSEFIIVNSSIDLAIEVLVNDSTPDYHDFISWTLIAKNYGPDNATGVKVLNTIPNGLIWLNEGQIPDFNNGIWNIGNLKVGETKSIEILCKVNKTGNINNLASISGNEFDINLDNNKDSKSINVRPAADLEITKTASKIEYNVGEFIDYVVNIVNNGPDTAHNVKVEDILEEGMDFISYSANKGIFNNNGSLWTVEELDADQSATLLFRTLSNKVGEVFNRVSVSSDEYDYNIDNNFDHLSVLVKNGLNIHNNTSESKVTSKINTAAAYKSVLEVKKTGSPIVILVMALSILISFGLGYFPKK
ncbi:MAG: DUF11 domain-containing protein, partial [Methanobrevibacter sp.]|nr:DUF11 domain-containing protein [Methanobrevibacter sp.]